MVEHGKPEPDIYIYAATNLGLKAEECLVLEDSPNGILAAFRAGCVPVMVPDQDAPDEGTKKNVYGVIEQLSNVIDIFLR
jgi:beta-phosphoglucomutase-like phosphatase (HAD superfamily)